MRILFFTENFPPETNAAATRVFERAVYWARWGHEVTIITCFPNFPDGQIFLGYKNEWYKKEMIEGMRQSNLDRLRSKAMVDDAGLEYLPTFNDFDLEFTKESGKNKLSESST